MPLIRCAMLPFLFAVAVFADDGLPISIVNYSRLPVHAAAVTLDGQLFREPVSVRHAENVVLIPLARDMQDGRAVVRLFVSLPPLSRLDLVAETAERWQEKQVVEAKSELLRNGVVRVEFGKKGWKFDFDAPKAALIEDGQLDFWVAAKAGDISDRGLVLAVEGLTQFIPKPPMKPNRR